MVASLPRSVTDLTPYARARMLRWPAGVALGFLLVQMWLAPSAIFYPDTARYTELALTYRGVDRPSAMATAVALWCADRAEQEARADALRVVPFVPDVAAHEAACLASQVDHLTPTGSPRYQELFSTRPGYPAVVAVLSLLLGVKGALWVVPVAATLLAGLLVWLLLRELGASAAEAAGGQGLLYVSPLGWWGTQMLTEGPVLVGVVAAILGAVLCVRNRRGVGSVALGVGLVVCAATKYSTAVLLGAGLAAAAVAGVWLGVRRGAGPVVAFAGVAAVGLAGGGALLGMPGLMDSVQDMLTGHFAVPDVADPWRRLAGVNARYWSGWLTLSPWNLALVAGCAVGVWALWRVHRAAALFVAVAAVVGLAAAVVHPDSFEADRLYALAWLVPVAGLPLLAAGVRGAGRHRV